MEKLTISLTKGSLQEATYALFKKAGLMLTDYKYDCGNEIFTLMKI